MDYKVTISPTHEPVSLEQAKRHLRIDDTESDGLIGGYLRAARLWCENYSGRAFLWQTIAATADQLADTMILPHPPLIAVSSVSYTGSAGSVQVLSTDVFDVDTAAEPGRIVLAYNQAWPSERGHHHDVTITYIAGHAVAFTRSGNTLVTPGHLFQVNDPVQVYNIGGALPAGLSAGTTYYVRSVSAHSIGLALTETGNAVALTDDGTGTHYIDALPGHYISAILLRLTDLWFNRGDEDVPPSRAVRELLNMGRMIVL